MRIFAFIALLAIGCIANAQSGLKPERDDRAIVMFALGHNVDEVYLLPTLGFLGKLFMILSQAVRLFRAFVDTLTSFRSSGITYSNPRLDMLRVAHKMNERIAPGTDSGLVSKIVTTAMIETALDANVSENKLTNRLAMRIGKASARLKEASQGSTVSEEDLQKGLELGRQVVAEFIGEFEVK